VSNYFGYGMLTGQAPATDEVRGKQTGRNQERGWVYRRNWEFYRNTAFEELAYWSQYMNQKGLYKNTRLIYNPIKRQVNFYAGKVYPGRLSVDGRDLPYTVRNAIPFPDRMDQRLKEAVAQLWEWSNWQAKSKVMIRYASTAGNCLVEIIDDVEKGKVRFEVIWPEMVKDFSLDGFGNLNWYELEYQTVGEDGEEYTFYKRVDKESITYRRNGELFNYDGQGGRVELGYGFVPAVWVKHKDLGGDFGVDCFDGDYVKLEELNSLATHGLDNLHKNIDPPLIAWTNTSLRNALKDMRTSQEANEYDERRDFKLLRGGENGKLEPMVGKLVTLELLEQVKSLLAEIESSNPELVYYQMMRDKQYVSGPGARSMIGDAETNYDEASANYDLASRKLFEMAVAIAGTRYEMNLGGWQLGTRQQEKFSGWNLDSYAKDELNVEITPRPLMPWTIDDEAAMMKTRFEAVGLSKDYFAIDKQLELAGIEDEAERDRLREEWFRDLAEKSKIENPPEPVQPPTPLGKPKLING
jgi:hypothetical protein